MKVNFLQSFPAITERTIDSFEKAIGFTLPKDFQFFLKTVNGGMPQPNIFDSEYYCVIQSFYGLSNHERLRSDNLFNSWNELQILCSAPEHIITIANTWLGDYIALSLKPEEYGSLYIWLHDERDELNYSEDRAESTSYIEEMENVGFNFLSPNFNSFLDAAVFD